MPDTQGQVQVPRIRWRRKRRRLLFRRATLERTADVVIVVNGTEHRFPLLINLPKALLRYVEGWYEKVRDVLRDLGIEVGLAKRGRNLYVIVRSSREDIKRDPHRYARDLYWRILSEIAIETFFPFVNKHYRYESKVPRQELMEKAVQEYGEDVARRLLEIWSYVGRVTCGEKTCQLRRF